MRRISASSFLHLFIIFSCPVSSYSPAKYLHIFYLYHKIIIQFIYIFFTVYFLFFVIILNHILLPYERKRAMNNTLRHTKFRNAELTGIVVTCLLAPLFHFIYAWSGSSPIVGMFSAVNESVWEHSKIMYFPFLFYSIAEYFVVKPDIKRFWASKAVSLAFLPIVMMSFFYTYTGIFGVEILIVDIISTLVWLFFAFLISYHLYKSERRLEHYFGWFVFLLILVFALEALFTLFPPGIPLFRDPITGTFGFPPAA